MAAPRLLDKKIINAEVATQKKQQIDQGLTLAKKVDAIRVTLTEETGKLERFRDETLRQVHTEIGLKVKERDSLEEALKIKREEYNRLLTPPDLTEARKEIEITKTKLEQKLGEVNDKSITLEQGISLNIQRERGNEEQEQRLAVEKQRSEENLARTESLKGDAVKELFSARLEAQKIIKKAQEREEAVKIREEDIETRESQVNKINIVINEREADLQRRERKLRANQAVLIKSRNYINSKK